MPRELLYYRAETHNDAAQLAVVVVFRIGPQSHRSRGGVDENVEINRTISDSPEPFCEPGSVKRAKLEWGASVSKDGYR